MIINNELTIESVSTKLDELGAFQHEPAIIDNDFEPVAAIAAQGLLRLGSLPKATSTGTSEKYTQAGITTLNTLLQDNYQGVNKDHQGILLHSVYHHPNGWDHLPQGSKVPNGEACMWGDYHEVELCLLAMRISEVSYYRFQDNFID